MADVTPALFDIDPSWQASPAGPGEQLSADRRRTLRQAAAAAAGRHPLTRGTLHPDAAPAEPRDAAGARCGNCRFRALFSHHDRTYPKCTYGWDGNPLNEPPRASNGSATDVRAWWPACRDYQPADTNTTEEQ